MRNIKEKPWVWIQFIVFVAGWVIVLYVSKTGLQLNWEAFKKFPSAVTIYTAFYFLFTTWGWRFPLFQGWLIPFPDLQGTWQGTLKTTWVNPTTGRIPDPIPVILVIKQSFTFISCVMYTEESTSYSHAAMLNEEDNTGFKKLSYNYTNTPTATIRDRSIVHDGAAILKIISHPKRALTGEYWTNRKTTGEISLTFKSKNLLESFPDDLKR